MEIVFLKSLLCVGLLACPVLILYLRCKNNGRYWPRRQPVVPGANITVASRKMLSAQHSLVEVNWRGTAYLLHVGSGGACVLDQKPEIDPS